MKTFLDINLVLSRMLVVVCGMICLCFSSLIKADQIISELVWVEREESKSHIYFGQYDGGEWSKKANPIYTSDNFLTTPTIGTSSKGSKVLIWSEQQKHKTVLMYKSASFQNSQTSTEPVLVWSSANVFSNMGNENLGPSVVYDHNDQAWVFWSVSENKPSDVYLVQSSEIGWTEPTLIHKKNDVPDYAPLASVNSSGNVLVEWTTYDTNIGDFGEYIVDSREYLIETATPKQDELNEQKDADTEISQLDASEVPIPSFVPRDRRVILHFPKNRYAQSVVLQ